MPSSQRANAPDQNDAPELSIMIVNWNTREMTLDCLRSIYVETRHTDFEVIVVDNASDDGSAQAIGREFPQIRLMAEDHNHGFAHASNISVARARGRYILLLNSDTLVRDGAIDRLMDFAKVRPEAKIWGGRTVYGDGRLNPTSAWAKITPWSLACMASGISATFPTSQWLNPECYGDWQRDSERNVDIVQGAFFLIEKAFWDELGGFDPAFFMYGEEADLCHRARAAGAEPIITPTAQIVHYGGQSTKLFSQKIIYILGGRIGLINRYFSPLWRGYGRFMMRRWAQWRAFAYGVAAMFSDRYAEPAHHWGEAWRRRDEWKDGPVSQAVD